MPLRLAIARGYSKCVDGKRRAWCDFGRPNRASYLRSDETGASESVESISDVSREGPITGSFVDFLPPPDLRIRPLDGEYEFASPDSISAIPFLIVFGEIRSAWLTRVTPPQPSFIASMAAQLRRSNSLKVRPACRYLSRISRITSSRFMRSRAQRLLIFEKPAHVFHRKRSERPTSPAATDRRNREASTAS